MEKKYIINPFAQKGRIITGDTFIGRYENLKAIASNVTNQAMPNNLAIIGYPRIGKSSLAKQSIIEQKSELIADKKIPIWIDFSKFSNKNAFFKFLVRYSSDELKKNNLFDGIEPYVSEVLKQETWDDITYAIEKYFEYTIGQGYYFIFILDEFDEARSIFHSNVEAFKMLRELAYDSQKYGVAIVTTSRRSIKEIEVKSDCSSSTFNLIFSKEYLRTYNDTELEAYFQLYEQIGVKLNENQKKRVLYYCGGHPYLLAFLGFEIVECYKNSESIENIDAIFDKIRLSVLEYYEQLIELLKEDKTFEKILQILFGPVINVIDDDIKELRDTYGLLQDIEFADNDKGLVAFSTHFQEYLQNVGKKIDFWSLWINLETSLRELITNTFKQKHQEEWQNMLIAYFPLFFNGIETEDKKIKGAIHKRKNAREDYKSDNLLDYLDAQPLFEIILSKNGWNNYFKEIFGGDKAKKDFQKKMELIIMIRNPYAHSRFHSINPTTVQQAEIYCKEILEVLQSI
jgi:hypothetical protein